MPTPLQWKRSSPDVITAIRVIPGYGTVCLFARFVVTHVFITVVLLPEQRGLQPEIVRELRTDHQHDVRLSLQEYIDDLERQFASQSHPAQSVAIPPYILLRGGRSIVCMTCGMESQSPADVAAPSLGHGPHEYFDDSTSELHSPGRKIPILGSLHILGRPVGTSRIS